MSTDTLAARLTDESEAERRLTVAMGSAGACLTASCGNVGEHLVRIRDAARQPLEARVLELEEALSTCGDFIVGLGLPAGARPVWETEYHAIIDLIDRLVTKPHPWLAALPGPVR